MEVKKILVSLAGTAALGSLLLGSVVFAETNGNGPRGAGSGPGRGQMMERNLPDGERPGTGRGMMGTTTPIVQGNGQPVIGGTITAVSGNTLTISNKSGVTYTVDATNATIEKSGAKSSVSAIAIGDNVVVQGTVSGTSVVASSIIDRGATPVGAANATSTRAQGRGMGGFFGAIGGFFRNIFGFF